MANIVKQAQKFTEEVQVELRRITWPDSDQLRSATIVILVFVVIMSLVIALMDGAFSAVVQFIIDLFAR